MNSNDLIGYLKTNETGDTANDLLYCLDINAEKRFHRACKMLENLMKEIRQTYPDASYIVSDFDNIDLLLGSPNKTHTLAIGDELVGEETEFFPEVRAASNILVGIQVGQI